MIDNVKGFSIVNQEASDIGTRFWLLDKCSRFDARCHDDDKPRFLTLPAHSDINIYRHIEINFCHLPSCNLHHGQKSNLHDGFHVVMRCMDEDCVLSVYSVCLSVCLTL